MDHPNIAKVFDAGTTAAAGRYFVMELVKGDPDHRVLRQAPADSPRTVGAVPARLPGGAARAQQGHHPPRPQALEHPGGPARRRPGGQGDRLRRRQGDRPAAHRQDDLHAVRADDRHAAVHEPRAGGDQRPGHRHAQRRLQPRRAALRAADRDDAVRREAVCDGGVRRDPTHHQGGGAAQAQHAAEHDRAIRCRRSPAAARRSRRSCRPWCKARSGLDRDEGAGEGPRSALRHGQRRSRRM